MGEAASVWRGRVWRGVRKYLLVLPVLAVLALACAVAALDSPIGHRVLADWLAGQVADNGLSVTVGRIDGSIFGRGQLDDVAVRDADGVFLRLPEVTFDWQPLAWLDHRLLIEDVVARRGVLLRQPVLRPTETTGPVLPGFGVTVRRLAVQRLLVARGVFDDAAARADGDPGAVAGAVAVRRGWRGRAGSGRPGSGRAGAVAPVRVAGERRIDLTLAVEIHKRRAFVRLDSRLGGGDRLDGVLDADEPRGKFDLAADYVAPKGGLLAALTGAAAGRRAHIGGAGGWAGWRGTLTAFEGERRLAALGLGVRGDAYAVVGSLATAPFVRRATLATDLGPVVAVDARGVLADRVLSGRLRTHSATLATGWAGGLDLGAGAFRVVSGTVAAPGALSLGDGDHVDGVMARVGLDGAFGAPVVTARFSTRGMDLGHTWLAGLGGELTARKLAGRWAVPVRLTAARVVTGTGDLDRRLVRVRGTATLAIAGGRLTAPDVVLSAPGIGLALALSGDMPRGAYTVTGRGRVAGWEVDGLGAVGGAGPVSIAWGRGGLWQAQARLAGAVERLDNHTLAALAGGAVALGVDLRVGHHLPLWLPRISASAPGLSLALAGVRGGDGVVSYAGAGHQATYGAFDATVRVAGDGTHATLALADPLPAAGIRDVTVGIDPVGGDYALSAKGQSTLGPFSGEALLALPAGAAARLEVHHLGLSETAVSGALVLGDAGADGTLTVAGGGVSGTVKLSPQSLGEAVDLSLAAHDTRFAGPTPLAIANGRIEAHGLLLKHHTSITASMAAQGVGKGRMFIGQTAAQLRLVDGTGTLTASLAGRRGSRFAIDLRADIAPDRLGVSAKGTFAGQPIATRHRAVLTQVSTPGGTGWQLSPSEIDIGKGRAVLGGTFSNGSGAVEVHLLDMPLALGDVVLPDLGLGGTMSGVVRYDHMREAAPVGEVQLMLRGLTRSGLMVTSKPIDLAVVGRLDASRLEMRAAAQDQGKVLGRVQALVTGMAPDGDLAARVSAGRLAAGLRYAGPADVLWRLLAFDAFDLSGPIDIAADVDGTVEDPHMRGSLAGSGLRLQSAETGTDVSGLAARGAFAGSQLTLASVSGVTAGGGVVVGSGTFDFAGITDGHGPRIDLKLAATKATVLARSDMAMAVTGPLRIVSDGSAGTIAGRVTIDSARWQLGQSEAAAALPAVAVREVNRRADIAPQESHEMPWRFLVDANGPGRIKVVGLGLDSEWGARVQLRGTIDDPVLSGAADLVQGSYEFSGQHFDLTRGRITFDGEDPPDPVLDIAATANVTGLSATVAVRGTSLRPQITFSSTPALPEEEVISWLLFGESVEKISAPEAVQLGAAVASLHGGGGLDPINKVRSLIGLDRLRIVSADPTIPRQAAVAVGKYIGHRIYLEAMTDGHQYSASNLELRLKRWLSLLGSISTVGRNSVNARVSHDY